MKHHIRHIIILAIMLVGNVTAWADETVTFTFCKTHENIINNSYLVYNGTNYKLNADDNNWFTTATTTAGGVTVTIDYSPSNYGRVVGMSPSDAAYADNYRYVLNFEDPFTLSFSASKYISHVKVYCTDVGKNWEENATNNTMSCFVRCGKGWDVYKIDVTLTDTKPLLDISGATVSGISDSYDYTGSAIEPAISGVTLNTGTLSPPTLTAGTDYTVSYANNINAGIATLTLTAKAGSDYTGTCSRDFTINKVAATVTGLTLANVDYNGTAQPLCSGGTATGGTLMYSIDGGSTWSTDVPTATAVGSYNVYYRVDADQNHTGIASTLAGTATIKAATVNYGCLAVTATSATDVSLTIGESDGTAAQDITIPADIDVNSITMQRTFTPGKAATIMLPFSITASKVSGGTFYSFIGVDKSGAQWDVVMQEVNRVGGTLQAHTPYLFMPTAETMTFSLGGQTVTLKANSQQTYTVEP